ncbi:MAG: 30S ribosomal protein S20 [Bacteroidota bacterium]
MAHHKSAKKRIKTTERRTADNKSAISKIKTLTKGVYNSEDKAGAEVLYKAAVSSIDKNAVKGRLHKNTAARQKAALTKYINSL